MNILHIEDLLFCKNHSAVASMTPAGRLSKETLPRTISSPDQADARKLWQDGTVAAKMTSNSAWMDTISNFNSINIVFELIRLTSSFDQPY